MKTVGKRSERRISLQATGAQLAEGARFNEVIAHLAQSTFIPKGLFRFKSHKDANRHQQDCLARGMSRLASERE